MLWDLGTVTLVYVLGEVRGDTIEGWSFQKSGLKSQPRVTVGLCFQKCLLFSKQFMHQGSVAETTR